MRRILFFLIILTLVLAGSGESNAQTKAYRVISKKSALYSKIRVATEDSENDKDSEDSKKSKKSKRSKDSKNLKEPAVIIEVQRGDTVEAAPETEMFIREREDSGFTMVPVVYNKIRGFMDTSDLIPVKLSETDSITRIPDRPESKMTVTERSIVKYQDKVLNMSIHPMEWFWIGIGSLAFIILLFIIRAVKPKFVQNCSLFILIASILVSLSEIMYVIGMGDKAYFFLDSYYVGGFWSKVNLLLVGVAIVCQFAVTSFVDGSILSFRLTRTVDFDPDFEYLSKSDPKWIRKTLIFYSDYFILGLILLSIINDYMGGPLSIWVFFSLFAIVILPIIAFIKIGHTVRGIISEIVFIILHSGMVFLIATLGIELLWLVAILIGLIIFFLFFMPIRR